MSEEGCHGLVAIDAVDTEYDGYLEKMRLFRVVCLLHDITSLNWGLAGFLNLVGSNGAKWGNQGMLIGNPVQDAGYEIGLKGPKTDTLIIVF